MAEKQGQFTWQTDQMNPEESYDPLLMYLVKSISIHINEGEETGYIRIFKLWYNWDRLCMCAIQKVNGQDKRLKCFWMVMVVGARRTGLCVKNCSAAGFFMLNSFLCVSRMVHHPKGSIGVHMGQHPCGMLLTPCRIHAPMNWDCSEGEGGCKSISGRCS